MFDERNYSDSVKNFLVRLTKWEKNRFNTFFTHSSFLIVKIFKRKEKLLNHLKLSCKHQGNFTPKNFQCVSPKNLLLYINAVLLSYWRKLTGVPQCCLVISLYSKFSIFQMCFVTVVLFGGIWLYFFVPFYSKAVLLPFYFPMTLWNNSWKSCELFLFCRMFQLLDFLFTCRIT